MKSFLKAFFTRFNSSPSRMEVFGMVMLGAVLTAGLVGGGSVVYTKMTSESSPAADESDTAATGSPSSTGTSPAGSASDNDAATTTSGGFTAAAAEVAPTTTTVITSPTTTSPPLSPTTTVPSSTATTVLPPTTSTTTAPVTCVTSPAGGVANLRVSRVGRQGADIEWDCYPGIDPTQYHYDGAYAFERKGGTYGTEWSTPNQVYSGTKAMPMALDPDTDYWFRVAPLQNGQPGVWEEIAIHTLAY